VGAQGGGEEPERAFVEIDGRGAVARIGFQRGAIGEQHSDLVVLKAERGCRGGFGECVAVAGFGVLTGEVLQRAQPAVVTGEIEAVLVAHVHADRDAALCPEDPAGSIPA
jgi:hypothetical protein